MRVAHMIAKEESWFSSMLMMSAIKSVLPAIDKLILIDNGCSKMCVDMYSGVFNSSSGVKIIVQQAPGERDFSKLRNMCMAESSPGDLILKLDADDVHYASKLKQVFDYMDQHSEIAQVLGLFYHHRRDPWLYQCQHRKDIFFRQGEGTHWEKSVHEMMVGLHGARIDCDYAYHHFGYCKSRSELLYHWINYDILEFGEVKRYDISSVEAVDPNKDLHGQFAVKENQKYQGKFPPEVDWMFDGTMQKQGLHWDETGLVGGEFDPLLEFINERKKRHSDKV